jgi:AcrR family transcriptional regulator
MTPTRAHQKIRRRESMLAAAASLFDAQGYHRTTMEQIATASGSGIATVYKYFQSKEGVVCGLLQPDLDRILAAGERVIARPPADPARAVITLLAEYGELGGHNWARRELLRMTIFKGLGNSAQLGEFIDTGESQVQSQLKRLLTDLRRLGRLARDISVADATNLIFSLFNQHFGVFLTQEHRSFARTQAVLKRHIRLLFKDWRANGEEVC